MRVSSIALFLAAVIHSASAQLTTETKTLQAPTTITGATVTLPRVVTTLVTSIAPAGAAGTGTGGGNGAGAGTGGSGGTGTATGGTGSQTTSKAGGANPAVVGVR
jgi:hypothetical protein